jgi:hypothetical protein
MEQRDRFFTRFVTDAYGMPRKDAIPESMSSSATRSAPKVEQ